MDQSQFAQLDDKSVSWLEEEEQRVIAHLHNIRAQKNFHSSAFRLPPELLLQICQHVQWDDWSYNASWIAVTQVCSRWRTIALHSQNLWSYIVPISAEYMTTFLERAGHSRTSHGAPLKLYWDDSEREPAALSVLVPFTDQVMSIDITIWPDELAPFEALLQHPWNNLQSFSLANHDEGQEQGSLNLDALKPSLLPRLKSLTLRELLPSAWNISPIYRNLLSLSLSRWSLNPDELPTFEELLDILESCQPLQRLTLSDIEPEPSPLTSRRTIILPNLAYIMLYFNSPVNAASLLSHFHVPENARIIVYTYRDTNPEHGILACLPPDLSKLLPLRSISHVSVTTSRNFRIIVQCNRKSVQDTVHLEVANRNNDATIFRVTFIQLRDLCQYAKIQVLELCAHLSHLQGIDVTDWHQIFSPFSSLERLIYCNLRKYTLYARSPPPDPTTNSTLLRAVLETLTWPSSPDSTASRSLPELTALQLDGYSQELLDVLEPSLEQVALSRHRSDFSYSVQAF